MKLYVVTFSSPIWLPLGSIYLILTATLLTVNSASGKDIPEDTSEFYGTQDAVGTTDTKDEVITSNAVQPGSVKDIHEILEIVEDDKVYPVLKKDESTYTPTSKEIDDKIQTSEPNSHADNIQRNEFDDVSNNSMDVQEGKATKSIQNRIKRTTDPNQTVKHAANKRMKTGDTILNIHGAVKDSIGDASVGSNGGESSHIDTVVIHPSQFIKEDFTLQPVETTTKPSVINSNEVIVDAGSKVTIECKLPSNVTITKWTKDGQRATSGNRRLEIARAARGDAGIWRCVGRDAFGTQFIGDEKILRVYEKAGPPYLELDGRRLDAGNTWMPAREGTTLEVLCIVEGGVPAPILSWRVVGTNPAEDEHLTRYLHILPDNHTYGGITISRVRLSVHRLHHNTSLQCAREQRAPEPSANVRQLAQLKLDVTYPPSFVISRWPGFGVSLRSGGAAALRCDVDANPPARPYWHSDTNPTPYPTMSPASHATVRWNSLVPEHSGWYRCIAAWSGTQYSSIGYYLNVKPSDDQTTGVSSSSELPSTSTHMTVQFGGNLQLNCPKGSVGCWSRRVLSDNGSMEKWVSVGSQNAHGVLGIRGALYQEAGEYRCVGASLADQTRLKELKRVTIQVTGAPSITPLPALERQFAAEVCGISSGSVRWLAGGTVLRPGYTAGMARASPPRKVNLNCVRLTLMLHDSTADEVWLVATNPANGASVHVWPPRAPPPPRALASSGNTSKYGRLNIVMISAVFFSLVAM